MRGNKEYDYEGRSYKTGKLEPRENHRFGQVSNFRAQVNVDQRIIAYGYDLIVFADQNGAFTKEGYEKGSYAAGTRNFRVRELQADLKHFFQEKLTEYPELETYIEAFIHGPLVPDDERKREAEAFWREIREWAPPEHCPTCGSLMV
jgi:hypothetical protein